MKQIESSSEEETRLLGRRLAVELDGPQILLLTGELGAGKTAFTRGFLEGLGLEDSSQVHSPTFSLVNEYVVVGERIYHIDLYRLEGERDFHSIGLEEIIDTGCWVLIEWAEKLGWDLENATEIRIEVGPDETRTFTIRSRSGRRDSLGGPGVDTERRGSRTPSAADRS
jgi:tRNA threonylcarbamoyladenosine biosynthesis protein TsaE